MPDGPAQTSLVLAFDRGTLVLGGPGGKTVVAAAGGTWAWDDGVINARAETIAERPASRSGLPERPGASILGRNRYDSCQVLRTSILCGSG